MEHFGQAWCILRKREDNGWSWLPKIEWT